MANSAADNGVTEVPVLIVGGGPVGLSLACELGWRGIRCLLVERRDGSVDHPKMNQVGVRTVEFCRRWGVADKVRQMSIPEDFPRNIHFLTATTGYELARYEFPARQDDPCINSPEALQRCSQIYFDPILRDHARSLGCVDFSFATEFNGFEDDGSHVIAQVSDLESGEKRTIKSQYLVACDGAESGIREALGIDLIGDDALNYNVNAFFRSADHDALFAKGPAIMQWMIGDDGMWADIVSVNGKDLWRLSLMHLEPGSEPTKEEFGDYLRLAVGRDFAFEIVSVMPWMRCRVVAERYLQGRVLLVGDAVHQMSPTGGFGMNTGIQEAVDAGWKLAAVLDGWGGDGLLESYHAERRPAAQAIVDESVRNYNQFAKIPKGKGIAEDSPAGEKLRQAISDTIYAERFDREYDMEGVPLGTRYEGSPIVVPDGTPEPPPEVMTYTPTARPGHRAPHVWLADGRSTLDLFGRGFTLLRLGADPADGGGLAAAAAARDVPLATVDLDQADVVAAYQRNLVLVRPDGHVGWRGDGPPDDPGRIIDTLRGA